jgi:hypothetical protein
MGSKASKPQGKSPTDALDESFQPLLAILDGIKGTSDILNTANYAYLPAAAQTLFNTVQNLVDVDVNSLPEEQKERYRVLVGDYHTILRKLSFFLDKQTAAFRVIVAETEEAEPDDEVIRRAYGLIDAKGCKDLMEEAADLLERVVGERKEVSGAVSSRIGWAVAYGLLGIAAVTVLVASGVGLALAAATATVAALASVGLLGSLSSLPTFLLSLKVCLNEVKSLRVIEGNLEIIRKHLTEIRAAMSDTCVSYDELLTKGCTHKRLGESAQKCLVHLEHARNIVLERK